MLLTLDRMINHVRNLPKPEWAFPLIRDQLWVLDNIKVILKHEPSGQIYREVQGHNLVTDVGRKNQLQQLLNYGTGVVMNYLGVGSSSTAATYADVALTAELTGNANRLQMTDINGVVPFISGDLVSEVTGAYRWKTIAQAIFPQGDGNNGSTFAEFAFFNSNTFGAGTMWNHFIYGSPFPKSALLSATIQITSRS